MRSICPVLVGLAVGLPSVAFAQERPDVDAVIKTSLKSTPEHVEAVLEALREKLSKSSLVDTVYGPDETPEDGASPFRLVVQHTATVTTGNSVVRTYCDYKTLSVALGSSRAVDPSTLVTIWAMECRQTTSIDYNLMKWNPTTRKYQSVQRWSAPVPKSFVGMRTVHELESVAGPQGPRNPPACPLSVKEAKEVALMKCVPTDIPDPVMGLVTARLGRTKIQRAAVGGNLIQGPVTEAEAEVVIVNNSPWSISGVKVQAWWEDKSQPIIAEGDEDLEKPIARTRQGTVVIRGGLGAVYIPSDIKNAAKSGVNLVSVRFGG